MDALFGLPRKKAAGCSYRGALHKDLFFHEHSFVDEFVAYSEQAKHSPSVRHFNAFMQNDIVHMHTALQ
jgi:hypothetical protein